MFDVSFSELMLLGVIELIVIGPERLPKVARTIGHLVGRAQRYVSDVKTDIQREMDLDELNSLKGQMEDAARSVKSSMQTASDSLREPLDDARKALTEASASIENLATTVTEEAGPAPASTEENNASSDSDDTASAPVSLPDATAQDHENAAPQEDTATLPLPGFDDQDTTTTHTGKPS